MVLIIRYKFPVLGDERVFTMIDPEPQANDKSCGIQMKGDSRCTAIPTHYYNIISKLTKKVLKISLKNLIEKIEKKVINEDYGDLLILISKLKKEFGKFERFIKFAKEKLKNNKEINLEEFQIADLKKLKTNIINELHSRGKIA
ncbi:MAG: hypothetical protein ACOC1X_02710 [Promethearchaeota archaeon]